MMANSFQKCALQMSKPLSRVDASACRVPASMFHGVWTIAVSQESLCSSRKAGSSTPSSGSGSIIVRVEREVSRGLFAAGSESPLPRLLGTDSGLLHMN